MAIAKSDGSIVLTTKIDTGGLIKGFDKMKKSAGSANKSVKGGFVSTGHVVADIIIAVGTVLVAAFTAAAKKAIEFGKVIADYSNEAAKLASDTEASVLRLVDIYGDASSAVGDFIDKNALALGMSRSAAASFSAVYGNLFSVWADQSTNAALTTRYLQMTAVVASKTGRTVEDVQERIRSGLLGNTEAIEDLGIFVNVKTIEMTEAFQRMAAGKSWEQLDAYTQQQIRSMAILEQATAKYGTEVSQTSVLARSQLSAAYDEFRNTWGQAVNIILVPILNTVTNIVRVATIGLNAILGFTDKLLGDTEAVGEATDGLKDKQDGVTDSIKEGVKAQNKALAGFDDIQILSQGGSSEGDGAGGDLGLGDLEQMETATDGLQGVSERIQKILAPLEKSFSKLFTTVGDELDTLYDESLVPFGEWFKENLAPDVVDKTSEAIDRLTEALQGVGSTLGIISEDGVYPIINDIIMFVTSVVTWIINIFAVLLEEIGPVAPAVTNTLGIVWDLVVDIIVLIGDLIVSIISGLTRIVAQAMDLVGSAVSLIFNLINGIIGAFIGDEERVSQSFQNVWVDLINIVIAAINIITGAINTLWGVIYDVLVFIADSVIDVINRLGKIIGLDETIPTDWLKHGAPMIPVIESTPRLAQGAVIPPNREFMAVLGDQTQGTNIETPLATMIEAFQTALDSRGGYGGGKTIEVVLEVDRREFGRAVVELGDEENRRVGTRLVVK